MSEITSLIEKALLRLEEYLADSPRHITSIKFLKSKFAQIKEDLESDNHLTNSHKEWLMHVAPRIVFEGINDQSLLKLLEDIRSEFESRNLS